MTTETPTPTRYLTITQQAVLRVIRNNNGACARDFSEHDLYRFGARIHELRGLGYNIIKSKCTVHVHRTTQWMYRLAPAVGK